MSRNLLFVVPFLLWFWTSISDPVLAQDAVESQINQQVWKVFKSSYEQGDWKTFNSLHTDEVLRISRSGIRVGKEYRSSNKQSFERAGRRKLKIDFAFENRTYKNNVGYETGFYRVIYSATEKQKSSTHYGRFHVLLRRSGDKWLIAQDWDNSEFNGKPIDASDFDKAKLLKLD